MLAWASMGTREKALAGMWGSRGAKEDRVYVV